MDGCALLYDLRIGPRRRMVLDEEEQEEGEEGQHPIITHLPVAPGIRHDAVKNQNKRKRSMVHVRSVTGVALMRGYQHIATAGSDG